VASILNVKRSVPRLGLMQGHGMSSRENDQNGLEGADGLGDSFQKSVNMQMANGEGPGLPWG
jgi:hypothetical protein